MVTSMAVDARFAQPRVLQQLLVYDSILTGIAEIPAGASAALSKLVAALHDYFSVHMLLHNTYEHVFMRCRDELSHWQPEARDSLMDSILTPPLVKWQGDHTLETHKDLLAVTVPIGDPPQSRPFRDAANHMQRIEKLLEHEFCAQPKSESSMAYCGFAALVAVAKEWKFVLNKLLYALFGTTALKIADHLDLSIEELRLLPASVLLAIAEGWPE
jgi:hypothetical protein